MMRFWKKVAVATLLFAGAASAGTYTRSGACLPGDTEIDEDCTAQMNAEAACENAHDARVAAADVTLAAASAACVLGYAEKGYPTQAACVAAATGVHQLAIQRSKRTRDRCLGRVPECIYTCEDGRPPCCPGIDDAVDCQLAGGTWDSSRNCCVDH